MGGRAEGLVGRGPGWTAFWLPLERPKRPKAGPHRGFLPFPSCSGLPTDVREKSRRSIALAAVDETELGRHSCVIFVTTRRTERPRMDY